MSIRIRDLAVTLGSRRVVDGVGTQFEAGQLVGIIGPNGAGKSTLIRAILGLVPYAGRVEVDGRDIAGIPRAQLARRIAYLPQGQTLHWPLTVERLVGLGRLPHLAPLSRIGPEDQHAIERAMIRADVLSLRDRIATDLSGGERARVLLARALAVEAPALVADEPLASLDPGHQIEVMSLLRAEAEAGSLVVAVLHDLTMAARYCGRLLLIDQGRLVADGPPRDVLTPERLSATYGITAMVDTSHGHPIIVPLERLA